MIKLKNSKGITLERCGDMETAKERKKFLESILSEQIEIVS